jgi:hypothetical protein
MSSLIAFARRVALRGVIAVLALGGLLAGCGGGGGVEVGVVVPVEEVEVAPLALALTRVGPQAVEVEWSDDPLVASFLVLRDGFALARVDATSLVDASVFVDFTYCYRVEGYDASGLLLVAASSTGCITIFP